ncbi:MAG: DNA methyltransferase [Dehalococcoidia bacterium]|jgi:DNA modification methylase/superfamily II DNA or RNA helicase
MNYQDFLKTKIRKHASTGIDVTKSAIHRVLFEFQKDVVKWAVRKGRCAIFLDTGLGKTFVQLEWARLLGEKTLIIAPLSVARQTVREAQKIDIPVKYVREQSEIDSGQIFITNYEMISHFDIDTFGAVVLDESSILKAIGGKTRRYLTNVCQNVKYRMACTATPAPNGETEIGNHAEFLGVCTHSEMLGEFFVNANREHTYFDDNGNAFIRKGSNKGGQEWRLKHHAEERFFEWLSSWAVMMTKPSDLGYDDNGFLLPSLTIHRPSFVDADCIESAPTGQLFFTGLKGIADRASARRNTIEFRLEELHKLVNGNDEQWIVWCGLDQESTAAMQVCDGAIEVKGTQEPEFKAQAFEDFQDGKIRVLVTKVKIGGFGMNFQNAHNMVFFGTNDSWEEWYQAIRREWRFGQKYPVNVYVIMSSLSAEVWANVQRKDAMARRLRDGLINQIRKYEEGEIRAMEVQDNTYQTNTITGDGWTAMLGDSCEHLQELEDESVGLSVYSPPFEDLFTYSNSPRDLGNSRGSEEFFKHYEFIIRELLRVTKPGRLSCVHTSDIPAMASRDGFIGMKDFPGRVIKAHEDAGWVFFGRAFVQKNPRAQAIRTKAKGLLFVQIRKDTSDSRPAIADQVLIFKKPGDNETPIDPVSRGELDNETWIEWANGIWLGISESDTLQYQAARAEGDEKHICPLQLGTIERCIKLYSNPGEIVLTPFMGIGSEAYQALRFGRKAIGIELKPSYFDTAVKNLQSAEIKSRTPTLFDFMETVDNG